MSASPATYYLLHQQGVTVDVGQPGHLLFIAPRFFCHTKVYRSVSGCPPTYSLVLEIYTETKNVISPCYFCFPQQSGCVAAHVLVDSFGFEDDRAGHDIVQELAVVADHQDRSFKLHQLLFE